MAATKRKGLSKKVRFEVFKRDGFKCQYCGACAPETILEVDHIEPVSKGGKNDLMNLITSCKACNAGKSDTQLSDDAAVQKQRAMLDELAERREQLEMMLAWREGMKEIGDEAANKVADAWHEHVTGWSLNETGMQNIRKWLRQFSLAQILEAMDISADQYLVYDKEHKLDPESVQNAFRKIPAIARINSMPDDSRELYYIRGICRNRFNYCNESQCLDWLKSAQSWGVAIDEMKEIARTERNWTNWCAAMREAIEAAKNG